MICGIMISNNTNILGFHKDTKIFTKTGWKNIKDVKIGEEIATLNVFKREAEFLPCNEVEEYEYNGKMLQCGVGTKYRIRFCLTSSNKMLAYDSDDPCPVFLSAKYLVDAKKRYLSVNVVNKFKGTDDIKYVMEKKKQKIFLEGNDFVFLLGIFYAKAIIPQKNRIFLPLYQEEELASVIRDTLTKLDIAFRINYKGIGIIIDSLSLADYVTKVLGKNRWQRFIGEEIKELSSDLLKIFLKGVLLCCAGKNIACYRTNNDKCINDLFYILTKAGYNYTFGILRNVGQFYTSESRDFTYPKDIKEIDYNDKIYSIIIEPYNTLLIRFNRASGFWCGDNHK